MLKKVILRLRDSLWPQMSGGSSHSLEEGLAIGLMTSVRNVPKKQTNFSLLWLNCSVGPCLKVAKEKLHSF